MKKIPFKTNAGVMPKEKKGNIKNMNPEEKKRIKRKAKKLQNQKPIRDVEPEKRSEYSEKLLEKANSGQKLNDMDRSALVPFILKDNIDRVDNRLMELTDEFLYSKSPKVRLAAWREMLKYRLPQKHKLEADININISIKDYTDEVSPDQETDTFKNYELVQGVNNIIDAKFKESN